MQKWIIVEGLTEDGKQKEYQVSDLQEAKELCKKLNKRSK